MYDRIVIVKIGYSVPFGLRGTIVGIHPGAVPQETIYDIIFDKEFAGGINLRFVQNIFLKKVCYCYWLLFSVSAILILIVYY